MSGKLKLTEVRVLLLCAFMSLSREGLVDSLRNGKNQNFGSTMRLRRNIELTKGSNMVSQLYLLELNETDVNILQNHVSYPWKGVLPLHESSIKVSLASAVGKVYT